MAQSYTLPVRLQRFNHDAVQGIVFCCSPGAWKRIKWLQKCLNGGFCARPQAWSIRTHIGNIMPCQIVVLDGIRHSRACCSPSHLMTRTGWHTCMHTRMHKCTVVLTLYISPVPTSEIDRLKFCWLRATLMGWSRHFRTPCSWLPGRFTSSFWTRA